MYFEPFYNFPNTNSTKKTAYFNRQFPTVDKLDESPACLLPSVLVGGVMGLLISVPVASLSAEEL
jgi:hypothetical protein